MTGSKNIPAEIHANIPASLHSIVDNFWDDWCRSCEAKDIDPVNGLPIEMIARSWACSDFIARNCIRYPAMFLNLLSEGFGTTRTPYEYKEQVAHVVDESEDDTMLMRRLRELRQREMLRIAWRDLNKLATVETILKELTDLAVAMVSICLRFLEKQQAEKFGMPVDNDGEEQELLVFAMGKMGGGELNFSSDIDLIFAFAEDGETTGRRTTSHYEFYLAVIRRLVKILDEVTMDGFVYRVDTRLRPFGQSGPLAMSFSGLEQYYQLHGRDWERYAMIKAKLITGREQDKKYLQSMLTPFVYRRYHDFSMIESIREMKVMIKEQMKRKGMVDNIKLGPGGIREIEFIGQTLQLIRAGREPELRQRSIIKVLAKIAEKNYLTDAEVNALTDAYWYLRKLENRLQILNDKQTHVLPTDELAQQRITLAMGYQSWNDLREELATHQHEVDNVFQSLISPRVEGKAKKPSAFSLYWLDTEKQIENNGEAYQNLEQYLLTLGYEEVDQFIVALENLHMGSAMKNLTGDGARLMLDLLESLVKKIAEYPSQLVLFERVTKILKALAGRKVYISLLNEYPTIQLQMLKLCSTSDWFTDRLTRYPILLDSLLGTAESFREQTDIRHLLELELQRITGEDNDQDLEILMERMRQFKRQTVFTIAMLDVFYDEPVEAVSDHLTELANALLEKILAISWQSMVSKYGEPRCETEGVTITPSMGVVAYGKMGGNELGYGSDLDIIFVHDSRGEKQMTSGDRCIDNQQFFARVAQHVVHFLNTRTYSGVLYEADTRLRPDGQAGLMVSSIAAFERYQMDKAWTWEHQALVRARFVTDNLSGSTQLGQEFDRIRRSVLKQSREKNSLLQEVVEMRDKMRKHLSGKNDTGNPEDWDIKQGRGGLVDIEFMTQAGVLLHAEKCDDCIKHTATLELINELTKIEFYTKQETEQLSKAYRTFRKMKNWQKLQCDIGSIASQSDIDKYRADVTAVWTRLMPTSV